MIYRNPNAGDFTKRQVALLLALMFFVIFMSRHASAQSIRINAGGPAVTISGEAWNADTSFEGGKVATSTATIANTDKPTVYQSNRYGAFKYKIALPNGAYTLRLHFAETYFSAAAKRVFSVTAEGQAVLTAFDIFKEAGGINRALVKAFPLNVNDSALDLAFAATVDNAQINAIEVIPAAAGTITFSASTTLTDAGAIPTLAWTTTPAANRCEGSGAWSGYKSPSGSETQSAISTTTTYLIACYWGESTASLSWVPPSKNTDGSPITNLGGFRVLYGNAADKLTQTVGVPGADSKSYVVRDLSPGAWYFAVKAFNTTGQESDNSAVVSKTLGESKGERSLSLVVNSNPETPMNVRVQ